MSTTRPTLSRRVTGKDGRGYFTLFCQACTNR
jgi:hypothetical protein